MITREELDGALDKIEAVLLDQGRAAQTAEVAGVTAG